MRGDEGGEVRNFSRYLPPMFFTRTSEEERKTHDLQNSQNWGVVGTTNSIIATTALKGNKKDTS